MTPACHITHTYAYLRINIKSAPPKVGICFLMWAPLNSWDADFITTAWTISLFSQVCKSVLTWAGSLSDSRDLCSDVCTVTHTSHTVISFTFWPLNKIQGIYLEYFYVCHIWKIWIVVLHLHKKEVVSWQHPTTPCLLGEQKQPLEPALTLLLSFSF